MNDKQIEAFLAICETGSMNRAAEQLYITQPALKKRIDTLEDELGVALLQRTSEGCVRTQAGNVFLEGIAPLYRQMRALVKAVQNVQEPQALRVCTLPDISLEGQDRLLLDFRQENPDVLIEWVALPTSQWIEAVEKGRADLCCSPYIGGEIAQFCRPHLRMHPTGSSGSVVCVISPRHPLAKKAELSMEDLRPYQVYAGPLAYDCGGLKEYAEREGMNILPDDNAAKRYEVIDRCEKGAVYLQAGDYADSLRPLEARRVSGFTCGSCWVWNEASSPLMERFLRFADEWIK